MDGYIEDTLMITDLPEPLRTYAETIGIENLMKLSHLKGGRTIYIPFPYEITRYGLPRIIREERSMGKSIRELEEEYDLSRSTIYRYLK